MPNGFKGREAKILCSLATSLKVGVTNWRRCSIVVWRQLNNISRRVAFRATYPKKNRDVKWDVEGALC